MTKRTLWYVCLGLLCCLALTFVVQAAGGAKSKPHVMNPSVTTPATTSNQAPVSGSVSQNPLATSPRSVSNSANPFAPQPVASQAMSSEEARRLTSPVQVPISPELKAQLNAEYALNPANHEHGNPLDQGTDLCPGTVVGPLPYADAGTTAGYGNEYSGSCIGGTAPDVVYQYTATFTGPLTVSLCGSSYDTGLYARSADCAAGAEMGCNDDFCGLQSQITFNVASGTVYYIFVDGYSTNSGAYVINITGGPCDVVCQGGDIIEAAEAFDPFFFATDPTGGCNNTAYNASCDPDGVELFGATACGATVCGRVATYIGDACTGGLEFRDTDWYEFTLAQSWDVTMTVNSEVPVYGFLISGGCAGVVIELQVTASTPCTDASGTITLGAGSYFMWVGPQAFTGIPTPMDYRATLTCSTAPLGRCCYNGGASCVDNINQADCINTYGGTWVQGLDCNTPCPIAPLNDNCQNATLVTTFPSTFTGDNTAATADAPCLGWPAEVWYTWTSSEVCDLSIDLCGTVPAFGTAGVAVELGCPCTSYILASTYDFGCADGNIRMQFLALPAGTYYYAIYTDVGSMGPYTINFDCTPAVPCDVVNTDCPLEGEPLANCFDEGVDAFNGGCNSAPFIFSPIECNTCVFGTSGTFLFQGGQYRDTDWYRTELVTPNTVTWTAEAEFPVIIWVIQANTENCADYVVLGNASAAQCTPVTLSFAVPAGVYWFLVMPSVFTGVTCGSEYLATLTTATPCACSEVTDLTAIRQPGPNDAVNLRWSAEAVGYYHVFGTTVKNNDGDPDNGADSQWSSVALLLGAPDGNGYMTYTDAPLVPYMNYVVVHDCAARGRCCYNDPQAPTCAAPLTEAECLALANPVWTEGSNCDSPCPALVPGETCGYPIPLSVPSQVTGNTCAFMNDYDAVCPYGGSTAPDVVYSVTVASDMAVTFMTCNTPDASGFDVDSKIYVYESTCTGTPIACNDDLCNYRSEVDCVPLLAGLTYYVVVDGYGAWCGDYVLDAFPCTPCDVVCQGGDVIEPAEAFDPMFFATDPTGGCNNTAYNAQCDPDGVELFGAVACGQTVCGRVQTYIGDACTGSLEFRDTDWYEFTLTTTTDVTITLNPEIPMYGFIISGGCAGVTIVAQATASVTCQDASATAVGLVPGTYFMWAGPQVFTGIPNPMDYRMTLSCP